jgi:hypothetical protein
MDWGIGGRKEWQTYIVPPAMKKDGKNILFDSINIKTHNILDTIVDYYMQTCVKMEQVP